MPALPLRVAVIGCGFYAQNHLNAWRDLAPEGVALVAVCDRDPQKAEAAGQTFGAPSFTNAIEALEVARPDIVDIVTRHDTHSSLVRLAVSNGCGFVVQKPLAHSWKEICAIARDGISGGTFNAVHENFRFQAPILRLRRLIASGALGRLQSASIVFATGYDVFRAQPYLREEPRLILLDLGIHLLDLVRVLLGEVTRLSCETQKRRQDTMGEDTASLLLSHEGGAVSQIFCSFSAHRLRECFPETLIEIQGTQGVASLEAGGLLRVKAGGAEWEEETATELLSWTERPWHTTQESVLFFNRHILRAWMDGVPPETNLRDNVKTLALVDAAYRAAAAGIVTAPFEVDFGVMP